MKLNRYELTFCFHDLLALIFGISYLSSLSLFSPWKNRDSDSIYCKVLKKDIKVKSLSHLVEWLICSESPLNKIDNINNSDLIMNVSVNVFALLTTCLINIVINIKNT